MYCIGCILTTHIIQLINVLNSLCCLVLILFVYATVLWLAAILFFLSVPFHLETKWEGWHCVRKTKGRASTKRGTPGELLYRILSNQGWCKKVKAGWLNYNTFHTCYYNSILSDFRNCTEINLGAGLRGRYFQWIVFLFKTVTSFLLKYNWHISLY